MSEITKIAIIGLDTSHSTELPKLMQDPKTPENLQVKELRTVSCLRFETPFQNKEGLDARQEYLESIGVTVTENFDEAVAECDAIIIAINDPSRHLEYFEKCAPLGKPIFLDKPFADTVKNMHKIIEIANKIDTFDISIRPYEDCCTVFLPKNPVIKPKLSEAIEYENRLDIDTLIDAAVENTVMETITVE